MPALAAPVLDDALPTDAAHPLHEPVNALPIAFLGLKSPFDGCHCINGTRRLNLRVVIATNTNDGSMLSA